MFTRYLLYIRYFEQCVFKNGLLHRGGRLPVQRRFSTHHLAAILQRGSSAGVNLRLWVCASRKARRLSYVSRWPAITSISAAMLDISRKETAVQERDDFIDRLHS